MKFRIVSAGVALLGALALAGCGASEQEKTGLVKITEDVYVLIPAGTGIGNGLGANSGFVVGEDAVLVVDSRHNPRLAGELLSFIREVTDLPVKYLVNTHYHPEHTWGNSTFREAGAVIISSPETARDMKVYHPMYMEYYKRHKPGTYQIVEDIQTVLPDSLMGRRLGLDLGGVSVILERAGPAHTAGDVVVWVDGGRVVFAGGLVSKGYHPNLADRGSDYQGWISALRSMEEMDPGHIVPAEGGICEEEDLEDVADYIEGLRKACREMIEKGAGLEKAVSSVKPEDFMPKAKGYLHANLLPFNVQSVYRRELLPAINPGFSIDIPSDFVVNGGGGDREAGKVMWNSLKQGGYREIEVQWQPTSRLQVISQDIYDRVARFQGSSGQNRTYRIRDSKSLMIDGRKTPAAHGLWLEEKKGVGAGGLWTLTMTVEDGRLYTILCLESVTGGKSAELEALKDLEDIASTFRITGRDDSS